ncbi:MAG TPA: class I SAM-dependent methyltransferase [Kofleriaceae bacterium]
MRPGLIGKIAGIAKIFRSAWRRHGLIRTVRLWSSELRFDLQNRTATALDLRGGSLHSRNRSGGHEGSNPLLFAELIRHAPVDRASSVFLDFGAGKGRALLLAAQHGFRKAIGVEVRADLCAIARSNITTYRRGHSPCAMEMHCVDAAVFEVPDEVNVAYFFNPFGPEVMRATLAHITESLGRRPREFFVVYLHPSLEALFLEAGFRRVWREGTDGAILCQP